MYIHSYWTPCCERHPNHLLFWYCIHPYWSQFFGSHIKHYMFCMGINTTYCSKLYSLLTTWNKWISIYQNDIYTAYLSTTNALLLNDILVVLQSLAEAMFLTDLELNTVYLFHPLLWCHSLHVVVARVQCCSFFSSFPCCCLLFVRLTSCQPLITHRRSHLCCQLVSHLCCWMVLLELQYELLCLFS